MGNLIGEYGIFYTFLYAACIPFIRQLFADLDCLQTLILYKD